MSKVRSKDSEIEIEFRKKFWEMKIKRNKERDGEVNRYYKKSSWKIIRVWEHKIEKDITKAVLKIEKALTEKNKTQNRNHAKLFSNSRE